MTLLSVNINKIATLRNTRRLERDTPDLLRLTRLIIAAGAHGITIHPRPDERHIRTADVEPVANLVREHPGVEFNIEGNPFHGLYVEHCLKTRPQQCTLVPDELTQSTSDHGWDLERDAERLRPIVEQLSAARSRVSLFMDFDSPDFSLAKQIGAKRIELYTEPYARIFPHDRSIVKKFADAAKRAIDLGLEVNAGHDLNLENLGPLIEAAPEISEVSIGHALIADALEFGIAETVKKYLRAIGSGHGR